MSIVRYFYSVKLKLVALLFFILIWISFLVPTIPKRNIKHFLHLDEIKEDHLYKVFIIGKAAIGQYLWQHLLNGQIVYSKNGFYQNGNKTFYNINFVYLSGPGYIQDSIPQDVEFMVLVLNGRSFDKVTKAKEWFDYLYNAPLIKKVAVVLLGDERCENNWIIKYMKSKGGVIDLLFIVYDSTLVDDEEIFQWPLGVATYRGFPNIEEQNVKHIYKRRYKCNFMGTIYKNSSRETLNITLRDVIFENVCYLFARDQWVPEETYSSLRNYIDVLQNSDLTLSPVGVNSECYRIYEAMSLGSIPVVENTMTPGKCASPLRLLKRHNAPFIYVKDWSNLSQILINDMNLNFTLILQRRKNIIHWYRGFKLSVAVNFVKILKKKFFSLS